MIAWGSTPSTDNINIYKYQGFNYIKTSQYDNILIWSPQYNKKTNEDLKYFEMYFEISKLRASAHVPIRKIKKAMNWLVPDL